MLSMCIELGSTSFVHEVLWLKLDGELDLNNVNDLNRPE